MTGVWFPTPEQRVLADRCRAEADKFTAQPALHGSESAIAHARSLVEQAALAGLPEITCIGLRLAVAAHEADDMSLDLPEHLRLPEDQRQFKNLP